MEIVSTYFDKQYGYMMGYTSNKRGRIPRRLHRLLWEQAFGPIPEGYHIDHINGDKVDNRLENLRLATNQENSRNREVGPMSNIDKRGNSYRVKLMVDGKTKSLGSFSSLEEAQKHRDEMRKKYYGEFAGRFL